MSSMISLHNKDNTFVISEIEHDGYAWTQDCDFRGESPSEAHRVNGWCIASPAKLQRGVVVLVEDD